MLAMAKSGKPRVSVLLLAVLAVAVSHHPTHTEAGLPLPLGLAEAFGRFKAEDANEVAKHVLGVGKAGKHVITVYKKDHKDERSAAGAQGSGSTPVIENKSLPQLIYVGVTDIKVGDDSILGGKGSSMLGTKDGGGGGVLVSDNFPLTFLNSKAYELLKAKVSNGGQVESELSPNVDQPCYNYKSGTLQPITLVFDGGQEMKVEANKCWYKQSDGSACLAILPSPWSTGETILGTMLQAGMNVDGDKVTFQTSAKDGTSSKSNTAADAKPLLGVWVLLLLAYIAC